MREFILLSLKGFTNPNFDINDLQAAGRMDTACRAVSNALWLANDIRRDTIIHIALSGPNAPPKIVSFYGDSILNIQPDERSIALMIKSALKKGISLELNETADVSPGIKVSKNSFEALVKEKASSSQLFYLKEGGEDLRNSELSGDLTFILGDHIGIPRKTEKLLKRLGVKEVSIGPKELFASHCIAIVHNEIDRKGL